MRKTIHLGLFPAILLGASLFVIGLLASNHIVNNWWPFDVSRVDLVRATVTNQIDAATILEAANWEIVLTFLSTIFATITGLMLPLAHYLNKRFAQTDKPAFFVVLRQSMWVGVWIAFCLWLQMNRSLGLAVAGLVAAVLAMFELLLQVRFRASQMSRSSG